ncbi:hypothetical protein AVJ23_06060 [Pseudoponticoccus marisrubri]|uniref:Uncharacterized protein n=1 Tax=Pseudoponticoccus marisrubri TaxID=1685382 RepID=A0A0W7WL45_9RHOB|nr:hypothetical protein AVJ23_06060 [Pseudoponticoccus marisrubri]
MPWLNPTPVTRFASLDEVGRTIDETVHTILADAAAHDLEDDQRAPALALAPSPGSGKTTRTQAILASQPRDLIGGDALFLSPTADLSAEACDRALAIHGNTTPATQIRGRSAIDPLNPGERMCQKWELAEQVARAGLKVGDTLCQLREGEGADETVRRCPFFDDCAYQRQSRELPEESAVDRYAAHNFVYLPTPTGRNKALRVIDEKFWPKMLRQTVAPVHAFTRQERFPRPAEEPIECHFIHRAAHEVVDALRVGRDVSALPYHADLYRNFAKNERENIDRLPVIKPDMTEEEQTETLARIQACKSAAHRYAAIWEALADAWDLGRATPDRLTLQTRTYTSADGGTVEVEEIVCHGSRKVLGNIPTLILDADASETILGTFFPKIEVCTQRLKPNAEITQVSNLRMSTTRLLGSASLRRKCRMLIETEVARDRNDHAGGVLVGCTKKVARRFFEEAGLVSPTTPDREAVSIMLNEKLFGASWLWFGDRALGSNRYEDYATVIVLGRNELPVEALEDQGRSLFGDKDDQPLEFVEADKNGRRQMPEVLIPYEMTSGASVAAPVRMHPDERIREIQMQHRECCTRQLVERLRLARARYRKRVILVCNIPIPGLPVDNLVRFDDLLPRTDRLGSALREATRGHRSLILTAKELPKCAPDTFSNEKAAEQWLARIRKNPRPAMNDINSGVRGFGLHAARIRRDVPRARLEICLVLVQPGECPRAVIEAAHGPLRDYAPIPTPDATSVFGSKGSNR